MKTSIIIIVIVFIAAGVWFFLKKKDVSQEPVPTSQGQEVVLADGSYAIDPAASSLAWRGSRPLVPGGYFDNGKVDVQSGSFGVSGGAISSGTFMIDMTSIAAVSTGRGAGQDMLSNHLKSADFFDVANFPTATFTLASVSPTGEVNGNLTIKGVTNPVTFPAVITTEGDVVRAQATIELDRTLWNVRYGSDKFFQNLGDNLVADTFSVTLDLVARKAN